MKATECPREPEIVDAVVSGRWPDHCDQDLRDHAQACGVCRDLVVVLGPLQQEHADACREASVPSARVIWWRAQVRARAEAAQTVTQPITWLNGITTVSVIAVAIAVMGAASRAFATRLFDPDVWWGWLNRLADFSAPTRAADAGLAALSTMRLEANVAMWGVGACLILAPLALYWILVDD